MKKFITLLFLLSISINVFASGLSNEALLREIKGFKNSNKNTYAYIVYNSKLSEPAKLAFYKVFLHYQSLAHAKYGDKWYDNLHAYNNIGASSTITYNDGGFIDTIRVISSDKWWAIQDIWPNKYFDAKKLAKTAQDKGDNVIVNDLGNYHNLTIHAYIRDSGDNVISEVDYNNEGKYTS
jgi:hypothetical protein